MSKLAADDLLTIIDAEIKYRGLCSDHIDSGNDFFEYGIQQIMTKTFTIEKKIINERNKTSEDLAIDTINVVAKISGVRMEPPSMVQFVSSKKCMLTPQMAIAERKTYGSSLYATLDITATATLKDGKTIERKAHIDSALITLTIPIMTRSKLCNLYNKSTETLIGMREDPNDYGGVFIIKGVEWVINSIESTVCNMPRVYRNAGFKNEITRLELISKPGDAYENSSEIMVKLLTHDQLVCVINHQPFNDIQIPFYILFRLLGWSYDKQIVDWIAYEYESKFAAAIVEKLDAAFKAKYPLFGDAVSLHDTSDILRIIHGKIYAAYPRDMSDPIEIKFAYSELMAAIDKFCLPHVGIDASFRHEKAQHLAQYVRLVLMVDMKAIDETDRDSYKIKRAHSAGVALAKTFKQQFGFGVAQPIRAHWARMFKQHAFAQVDLAASIAQASQGMNFDRSLAQAITTGSKSHITMQRGRTMVNRLTSQQLHRKNQLNYISTMRQINVPNHGQSKQSERAKRMRDVNPSMTGYICCVQTNNGEMCGLTKQIAVTASITLKGSSEALKTTIAAEPDLIALADVTPQLLAAGVATVKVNGHWIGCVARPHEFTEKCRALRRRRAINMYASIYWEPIANAVELWIDVGRLTRPLLIVYSNYSIDYADASAEGKSRRAAIEAAAMGDMGDFRQGIRLTAEHVREIRVGRMGMRRLCDENIIEYISPGEHENLLIAPSYDDLMRDAANPLRRYTHCDIPQAWLGFAALLTPFGAHNPTGRTLIATQQSRQTSGWYALNWPHRVDKDGFILGHCETPLVRTIIDRYLPPNGANITIAIMPAGYNQEDSLVFNAAAVRRGLFDGVNITYATSELDKSEQFQQPDPAITADIKRYASYDKIDSRGVPRIGTIMEKNDVIIGKVYKYPRAENGYTFADRSQVYKGDEVATVMKVIISRTQDGNQFATVQLLVMREPTIGDKFTMRSGQKGVCGFLMPEEDMPFTAAGYAPDILFNPFSLPSRMTVSTMMEVITAKVAAIRGTTTDATFFCKNDMSAMRAELKALGYNSNGREKMYSGHTGAAMDCEIFTGPVYYARIQKFADKNVYAVSHGSTDILTRQPGDGRGQGGGLRLGEMERNSLESNGVGRYLSEKFFDHSDGFAEYVCRRCGSHAVVNHARRLYTCKTCRDGADIVEVDSSWATKLLKQEIGSLNIGMRYAMRPYEYEVYGEGKK